MEFDVISLLSSPVVSVSGGTLSAVATTFLTDYYYKDKFCLLYTSPSPRDVEESRMPSSA